MINHARAGCRATCLWGSSNDEKIMTAIRIKRQETMAINFNLAAYILWGTVLVFQHSLLAYFTLVLSVALMITGIIFFRNAIISKESFKDYKRIKYQYFRILTASGIYIVLCIVTILAL